MVIGWSEGELICSRDCLVFSVHLIRVLFNAAVRWALLLWGLHLCANWSHRLCASLAGSGCEVSWIFLLFIQFTFFQRTLRLGFVLLMLSHQWCQSLSDSSWQTSSNFFLLILILCLLSSVLYLLYIRMAKFSWCLASFVLSLYIHFRMILCLLFDGGGLVFGMDRFAASVMILIILVL